MVSKLVIAFLLRSNCLLISWLQSLSTAILEPKKIKCVTVSIVSHLFTMNYGTGCHDLSFLNVEFKPIFSLSSFTFIKRLLSSSSPSALMVVSSAHLRLFDISPGNHDSSL